MNGNWYPWSGGPPTNNTPQDYIKAWQHTYNLTSNIFDSTNVRNSIAWLWSPYYEDFNNLTAEKYYPGNNYVDWVGLSGFNFGYADNWSIWELPGNIFDNMILRVRNISENKLPVAIEWATASIELGDKVNISCKLQWINTAFQYIKANNIALINYYNSDFLSDFAVFGGQLNRGDENFQYGTYDFMGYSTYREGVATLNDFRNVGSN